MTKQEKLQLLWSNWVTLLYKLESIMDEIRNSPSENHTELWQEFDRVKGEETKAYNAYYFKTYD
jgi:hypothetical protein